MTTYGKAQNRWNAKKKVFTNFSKKSGACATAAIAIATATATVTAAAAAATATATVVDVVDVVVVAADDDDDVVAARVVDVGTTSAWPLKAALHSGVIPSAPVFRLGSAPASSSRYLAIKA